MVKNSLRVHVLSSLPQKMIESEDDNSPNIYFNLHIHPSLPLKLAVSLFPFRENAEGPLSKIFIESM